MAKVYFVRHQMGGVLWDTPFSERPSDEQIGALVRRCFQSFGANHPKSNEPYWTKIEEVEVLGPSDVPEVPERSLSASRENTAALPGPQVSAVGHVSNPKEGS